MLTLCQRFIAWGDAVKRVVVSILLLMVALFISKPFVAEPSQPSVVTGEQYSNVNQQTYFFKPNPSDTPPILAAGCPCDTPYTNPTISLVIAAAAAACLAMASFIYGSHFIAGLVAG